MFKQRVAAKWLVGLILIIMRLSTSASYAQEGIISSVYISERTALQKMQAARKAGNEEEVKRLSTEIKELVDQKKNWARDLMTLTESSIEKIQNDNAPDLSAEQRLVLLDRLDRLNSEKRLIEYQMEENKWGFFLQKHAKIRYIKDYEDQIAVTKEYAASEIKKYEEQIAKAQSDLTRLTEEHAKELQAARDSLQEQMKRVEDTKKQVAEGKTPADNVKSAEQATESWEKSIADMTKRMAEGTYTSRAFNWTSTGHFKGLIETNQNEISRINAALADESMQHRYSGRLGNPSIKTCREVIARTQAEIDEMTKKYTSEDWDNRKNLRQSLQDKHIEILKLQEEVGLKDEKLDALIARRNELEQFLMHDFLTELPKEDSGFIKAIKWINNTLDRVNEVVEKFEKFKKVVDLVKNSSNPYKAVNFLFEEATGKGLTERLASKLLPDKVYNNPLVQRLIKGESINRQELLKEAVIESLPPETRRKVEQAVDLINTARSGNMRDLIAQHGFEQAMRVIDSQPELKKAWDTFQQAHNIINNPGLIQDRLEESIRERVKLELKAAGRDIVDSMVSEEVKTRVAAYQEKIKKIEEDLNKNYRLPAEAFVEASLVAVQKKLESHIGIDDADLTDVEAVIKGYILKPE